MADDWNKRPPHQHQTDWHRADWGPPSLPRDHVIPLRQIRRQRDAAWLITGGVIVAAVVLYLAVASALAS